MGEIRAAERELRPLADRLDLAVLPLHGDLPAEQQDAALMPLGRRKVVLATNVAETSVTVDGVTGVVDTGLARVLTFDPHVGLEPVGSDADLESVRGPNGAGRAGRTRPGVCIRLWNESGQRSRPDPDRPGNPPCRPRRSGASSARAGRQSTVHQAGGAGGAPASQSLPAAVPARKAEQVVSPARAE